MKYGRKRRMKGERRRERNEKVEESKTGEGK